jgi:S1-C subfamily serine protease
MFVSDCLTASGDSGGPFCDLDGRFVGLTASSFVPKPLDLSLYCEDPGRFGPFSSTTARLIETYLEPMIRRQIAPYELPFWDRFVGRYRIVVDSDILPRAEWKQGEATLRALAKAIRVSGPAVVFILDESGHEVSLGTVIDADGWVMTTVSTLPATPRCRLADSRIASARVVGISPPFDLALLKVPMERLAVPAWGRTPPVAGTILASLAPSGAPTAFGVVSVPERNLPGPFPTRAKHLAGRLPHFSGKPADQGLEIQGYGVSARDAGLRGGDVILSIAGKQIKDSRDLDQCVADRGAGESVRVRLNRGSESLELTLELAGMPSPRSTQGFPTFFELDIPLHRRQCGGPLVDLDGDFAGITVFAGEYGCMVIPSASIRRLFAELKPGGSLDKWDNPRAMP